MGSTLFVLYNRAVLQHKTTMKCSKFVFSFDSNNKLNDQIIGSLVRNGSRVFNDFIVGVKSYMEVLAKLPILYERCVNASNVKNDPQA